MHMFDRIFNSFMVIFVTGLGLGLLWIVSSFYLFATGTICKNKGDLIGFEHNFSISTGCMYKINGQWLPNTMLTAVERNGKIVFVPSSQRLDVQIDKKQ